MSSQDTDSKPPAPKRKPAQPLLDAEQWKRHLELRQKALEALVTLRNLRGDTVH